LRKKFKLKNKTIKEKLKKF